LDCRAGQPDCSDAFVRRRSRHGGRLRCRVGDGV
jgi:hypothetical protein